MFSTTRSCLPDLTVINCSLAPRPSANWAKKVGFGGLPEPPPGKDVRLIVVARRDAPWIHRALETSEVVGGFKVHEVD